jgi:hypothetical protein
MRVDRPGELQPEPDLNAWTCGMEPGFAAIEKAGRRMGEAR